MNGRNRTKLIACVVIAAIAIIIILAVYKQKAGINPYNGNDTYATYGFQTEGADYKTVKLSEVVNYADISKEIAGNYTYVRTQGIVVGAKYDEYGGDILLSDGSGNYLLIGICHACIQYYVNIMPVVTKGTQVEVSGMASSMAPAGSNLEEEFNLTQKLPETIGMITINELKVLG